MSIVTEARPIVPTLGPEAVLAAAHAARCGPGTGLDGATSPSASASPSPALELAEDAMLHVGVDLGTAYVVVVAVDGTGRPLAVASRFATVVRDGVVVDVAGATALVRELVGEVQARTGLRLTTAATTYPPGVPLAEVRACRYVVESAGLECTALVDEPTAANAVLRRRDGAVVDIGGGTTGVAVLRDGEVVAVYDDPTGGTHVSLVLAGHLGISLEEAEAVKTDPARQAALLPVIRPVFDKIGILVADHLADHDVDQLHLVGGTAAYPGMDEVIAERVGRPVVVAAHPLLVTPLGVALHDVGAPAEHTHQRLEVGHG